MPDAHSIYSASGFEAAMLCSGKTVLERGKPNRSSIHAATGTAGHSVFEDAIKTGGPARAEAAPKVVDGFTIDFNDDLVDAVQTAVDGIREIVGDGVMLSEQRVNYANYLNVEEQEAWGTADIIAVRGSELIVADLKMGQGVEVDARDNVQMMLYALGALNGLSELFGPFNTVRLVILQPRVSRVPSEWSLTIEELEAWSRTARSAVCSRINAERAFPDASQGALTEWQTVFLTPGEKQCRWCKAKATCPALRDLVTESVFDTRPATPDEFEDLTATSMDKARDAVQGLGADVDAKWLSVLLAKADMIDDWLKAVRGEVESRLIAGEPVPGFKLVEGKLGNRAWGDTEAAEKLLRETFRLPVEKAFDLKLISPTTAEKLAKAGDIGPRQWPKAAALITRTPGRKHVAPESDPRPALTITPVADLFDDVSQLV